MWKIQECLKTPKPYKWIFGKKKKIRTCYECGFYGICSLTRETSKTTQEYYGMNMSEDKACLEEYQKVKDEITDAINKIMEKCEHLSMADIKLILHEIAENLNPYIDVEEIE
jgi:hypothetical protein